MSKIDPYFIVRNLWVFGRCAFGNKESDFHRPMFHFLCVIVELADPNTV